jgi:hypothetical protein
VNRVHAVVALALAAGCSSPEAEKGSSELAAGSAGTESAGSAGATDAGSSGASGANASSGGASGASAGGPSAGGNVGTGGTDPGGSTSYPPGPPGCGLEEAAFCETFDAPAGATTRAGELDPERFSAARMCNIGGPSSDGEAVGIPAATVPTCRSGLPAQVFPSSDALVCDGNESIQSNHLLVLVAAQNYGQNSYRIRQPFDFADRTGSVVFDAEGYNVGLLGWISLEITEDPAPAPSFTLQQNFENGAIPRNGLEIQFAHNCGGDHVGVSNLLAYDDYVQNEIYAAEGVSEPCVTAASGKLNRFRVELSENHVEIFATDASADGVGFGAPVSILSRSVNLPFSRGYVHLTTHNHATLKYSDGRVDAWPARWDNVGFDGPAIKGAFREYEAPDSLFETTGKVNIGYRLADESTGPAQQIEIPGVALDGVESARIALGSWSLKEAAQVYPENFALNYRLNGHAWKKHQPSPGEVAMVVALPNAGTRASLFDVDVAELVEGTNVLELTTTGAPMSYPPVAFNIDLILALAQRE